MDHGKKSHRKNRPLESTYMNETGRVEIFRVSEETRKKVSEDTEKIRRSMMMHNMRSRELLARQETAKMKKKEANYLAMVGRWQDKTVDSPYHVNQYAVEEHRKQFVENKEQQRKLDGDRNSLVLSMDGHMHSAVLTPRTVENSLQGKQQARLALNLRQSIQDGKMVAREKTVLNRMLVEEIITVKKRFPKASIPESLFSEEITEHFPMLYNNNNNYNQQGGLEAASASSILPEGGSGLGGLGNNGSILSPASSLYSILHPHSNSNSRQQLTTQGGGSSRQGGHRQRSAGASQPATATAAGSSRPSSRGQVQQTRQGRVRTPSPQSAAAGWLLDGGIGSGGSIAEGNSSNSSHLAETEESRGSYTPPARKMQELEDELSLDFGRFS